MNFAVMRGKHLWLVVALGIAATTITCGVHHDSERRLASEQHGSNDDYGKLDFGGAALPASVLPTQVYVDTAYATVDPSDLLLIDVIVADSISSHTDKQVIADSLPAILEEVINSNWVVEVRSMSDLVANPFATVGKYADTFTYKDTIKQSIEKFTPALSRRNIADRSIRLPVYLLISDSDLQSDVQQKLDSYIAKDPRRRVFALIDNKVSDSFLAWQDSDNGKKMIDYSADLKIKNLNVVIKEFSSYIADTLRSNFHLHGFCDAAHRLNSYEREPRTMAVALKFHSQNDGYVGENGYHLTAVDDTLFIKDTLNDRVCLEVSYVYKTYPDSQQICRSLR